MISALSFAAIAVCVGLAGMLLARSSDRLGEAFHLERSVTGFLLLAAATSLPELVISSQVARAGAIDMATGSVLGSCLMNLLILAGIDLSRRSRGTLLSSKAAAHVLSGLASILLAALVAVAVTTPELPALGRLHSATPVILITYLISFRLVYLDRRVSRLVDEKESELVALEAEKPRPAKARPLLFYCLATAVIFLLASPLAAASENLAVLLGLSGTFFGAVFLALVTSLPEIVTTHEASRIGADDMAIGNILGSNAFNLLVLVAIDAVSPQPLFHVLGDVHVVAALGIIVTTSIAAMGMLYRVEARWWTLEPDAVAVVIVSLAFFYLIYIG
ncbi:MAG: hypothetical protein MI861_07660 [Pirellulales bacterium]|nr:hypothetical protein [Pirellulales bacterium]